MRRIAANRKKQTNIPEITLLDHFDTTDSLNEVGLLDSRFTTQILQNQGINYGKFGNSAYWGATNRILKAYNVTSDAKFCNTSDEWSVDFWFFNKIESNSTFDIELCSIMEIVHKFRLTFNVDMINESFVWYINNTGAARNTSFLSVGSPHVMYDRAIINGMAYISVYINGVRKIHIPDTYPSRSDIIELRLNQTIYDFTIDELCITSYSRAKGAEMIAIPTEPYSLK